MFSEAELIDIEHRARDLTEHADHTLPARGGASEADSWASPRDDAYELRLATEAVVEDVTRPVAAARATAKNPESWRP